MPAPLHALAHERGDARGRSREAAREERRRLLRRRKRRISRRTRDAGSGSRGERLQRRSAKHLDAVVVLDRVFRLVSVSRRLLVLVLVLVLVRRRGTRAVSSAARARPAKFDAQVPSRGRKRPRVPLLSRPRLGILSRDPTRSILRAHESRRFPRGENLFGARREKLGTLGFAQRRPRLSSNPRSQFASVPIFAPRASPSRTKNSPATSSSAPSSIHACVAARYGCADAHKEPRRDDEPRADSGDVCHAPRARPTR